MEPQGGTSKAVEKRTRRFQSAPSVVKELLGARADPEDVSERGQSSLMLAAGLSRRDLCDELLAASAQANGTDPEGKSALLLAAGAGCLPVCEVLLEARADLAQRTLAGACALDSCCRKWPRGFSGTQTHKQTLDVVSRLQLSDAGIV